ncbi:MAG: energy-coupling factor transporter ATPase [Anaerolineales bacterium]
MIIFEDFCFTYPNAATPALTGVSLRIPAGAFLLISGASGCGKTTLLRALNGLVPHFTGGTVRGSVRVNDKNPLEMGVQGMSQTVGFVFQDPEAQMVTDVVEDEIAFALENAAIPPAEMQSRIEETLTLLNLSHLRRRSVQTLSGGERQRVAIASALVLRSPVLALDEPTSQLDDESADALLRTLQRLNRELGLTIVLTEHRLARVLPFVSSVFSLESPALSGEPSAVSLQPSAVRGERATLEVRALHVGYGKTPVLRGANLELHPGEVVALHGANGTGKTTLLRALVGLIQPQSGEILLDGQNLSGRSVSQICRVIGYLPQDPNALLFCDTVLDELRLTLKNHLLPFDPVFCANLLEQLGLAAVANAYPRDLSTGQRQRAALAAILVTRPRLLLLDEPTRGLDDALKDALANLLLRWRAEGMGLLLVTHDQPFAQRLADRSLHLRNGAVQV